MQSLRPLILLAIATLCTAATANRTVRFHHFPVPDVVENQVKFWHSVFSQIHTHQTVIHDKNHPNLIIDVIDFKLFADKFNRGRPYRAYDKRQITKRYIDRYKLAFERFRKFGKKAVRYGEMEKRIFEVYRNHPKGKKYLYTGRHTLRFQRGLADEFTRAARRAERYLPYIEDIFRKRSLPIDLTRIAFVESMFNERAVSKVGASGIWQIMPLTGKQYLKLNKFIDERNSPLKASIAAADLLVENFRFLKRWPLAITAYNHGANGIHRATKRLKTKDIGKIIRKYKSPTFGFASRNFYAEFLAANIVYKERYKKTVSDRNPLRIGEVTLRGPISINELIKHTPLNESVIRKYNACLKKNAFGRHRYTPLPRNFKLIVPEYMQDPVAKSVKLLASRNIRKKRLSL